MKLNLVTCGNCGAIIAHNVGDIVVNCEKCGNFDDVSNFPDFSYTGSPRTMTPEENGGILFSHVTDIKPKCSCGGVLYIGSCVKKGYYAMCTSCGKHYDKSIHDNEIYGDKTINNYIGE